MQPTATMADPLGWAPSQPTVTTVDSRGTVWALTAGETPRPAAEVEVAKQATRTEGTTRVRGKTPPPGPLATAPAGAAADSLAAAGAARAAAAEELRSARRQAENRAAAASLLGLGL